MPTVLSTKRLKENQRLLLLNAGLSLVEYNAIQIDAVPFHLPSPVGNAIFTSQNAVEIVLAPEPEIGNCFCVGEKTKALLEENGQNVVFMAEYATELADYLVARHKADSFHFFCGNIRSDEIPVRLTENDIAYREIVVYKTTLNKKRFHRDFDAVLFFSPSGVRSYFEANGSERFSSSDRAETLCVCIGTTTASEAKNYSGNIVVANSTTVESVIAKAVKTIK